LSILGRSRDQDRHLNFTRYGLLRGQVLTVSQDAVIRDRKDRSDDRGWGRKTIPKAEGPGLNYSARISLDRTRCG
jgi:hemolysin D